LVQVLHLSHLEAVVNAQAAGIQFEFLGGTRICKQPSNRVDRAVEGLDGREVDGELRNVWFVSWPLEFFLGECTLFQVKQVKLFATRLNIVHRVLIIDLVRVDSVGLNSCRLVLLILYFHLLL
jgi:hypothetical protein